MDTSKYFVSFVVGFGFADGWRLTAAYCLIRGFATEYTKSVKKFTTI